MHLTTQASNDYLKAIELSLKMGIISFEEFMQRLFILYQITNEHSFINQRSKSRLIGYQKSQLGISSEEVEPNLYISQRPEEEIFFESEHNKFEKELASCEILNHKLPNESNKFSLLTDSKGKISQWEFHKGDADPNPSVPHGHSVKVKKYKNYKLNPYTGFIYNKKKIVLEEDNAFLIDLWNDDNFRQFVSEALNHFKTSNPKYRLKQPTKLPEKRTQIKF